MSLPAQSILWLQLFLKWVQYWTKRPFPAQVSMTNISPLLSSDIGIAEHTATAGPDDSQRESPGSRLLIPLPGWTNVQLGQFSAVGIRNENKYGTWGLFSSPPGWAGHRDIFGSRVTPNPWATRAMEKPQSIPALPCQCHSWRAGQLKAGSN